jgi:CubicO group peptidase (beta-lactamase class C family)
MAGLAALATFGITGLRAAPQDLSKQPLLEDRRRLQRLRERFSGKDSGVGAEGQSIADRLRLHHVPGAGIAVIGAGQVIAEHGYGLRRAGSHSAVTTETRFQAASISKPVTALATLQLVERGVLNLDEDVNRYLRSWFVPASSYTQNDPVTLRRIMSHTAGLTVHGFAGYPRGAALPTLLQILDGVPPANSPPVRSENKPGVQTKYSGGGVTIEQLILTEAIGRPFDKLMDDLVLRPLQMARSSYLQPPNELVARGAAIGHDEQGVPVPTGWHVYPEQAAAGLWTTAGDLSRYILGVQSAVASAPRAILQQGTAREMVTPQMQGADAFGLGPELQGNTFSHGGSNEGFRCVFQGQIDGGRGAVIMTNGENGNDFCNEVLAVIHEVFEWT